MSMHLNAARNGGYSDHRLPFGLNEEGRMVTISEVLRGKACACVCPKCRAPLVAKQGDYLAHHFAHASDTLCIGAGETALHMMGKQILADHRHVFVPAALVTHNGVSHAATKGVRFVADDVHLEFQFGPYRLDSLMVRGGDALAIEILVTHQVDATKRAALRLARLDTLEIDLGRLRNCGDRAEITKHVLQDASRVWLYNRAQQDLEAALDNAQFDAQRVQERREAAYRAAIFEAREAERVREEESKEDAAARVEKERRDSEALYDGNLRWLRELMLKPRASSPKKSRANSR